MNTTLSILAKGLMAILMSCSIPGAMFIANTALAQSTSSTPQPQRNNRTDAYPVSIAVVRQLGVSIASSWPAVDHRLQRELALSDMRVTSTQIQVDDKSDPSMLLWKALNTVPASGAVLIWIDADGTAWLHTLFRYAGTTINEYHRHSLECMPNDDNVEIAAIKVKEAVMAALYPVAAMPGRRQSIPDAAGRTVSIEPAKPPRKSDVKPSPSQKDDHQPEFSERASWHHRFRIFCSFGVAYTPGGIGPLGVVGGSMQVMLARRVALVLEGWISVLSNDISSGQDTASIRLGTGRLSGWWQFYASHFFEVNAGVRLGGVHLQSTGRSNTNPVEQENVTLFFGGIGGEISFRLTRHIRVPVAVGIGAIPGGVKIRFEGKTRAELDMLMLEAAAGIALVF